MLAIKGIYDGETIKLLEPIKEKRHYMVTVTFIEPIKEEEKPISSNLKILKACDIEALKEMVALGGDALEDTER